ncbi:MAG: C40 family peptidase [Anaerolineae bacterium]
MKSAIVASVLADMLPHAVKAAAALGVAILLVVAFVIASIAALLGMVAPIPATEIVPGATVIPGELPPNEAAAQALALAYRQLGMPYVWGGASPETSFDCSGLVQWVYGQVGVRLPRTAQQQYNATPRLAPEDLMPGDLVFFASTYPSSEPITHVGIYVGNGRMINAPTTGDIVREMPIFSDPYWSAHYAGGGRVR